MRESRARIRLDPDRLLPWVCVVAGFGWVSAAALKLPAGDGDLLWQRWLGARILHERAIPRALGPETFSAAGAPWTPHEWLFSTALAFGMDRGVAWLLPLACALAVGCALAAVVLRCRARGVSPVLSSAAVLVCVLATLQSFGVRAQVFGWAGLASVLWLLELEGPGAWAAVPLTMVWANLHASAFLAPAVAVLFALAVALRDRRWSREVARRTALAAACGAATLATPLGLDLPRYAAALLTSPIRHSISEWGATSLASAAFMFGALPLLLVLVVFGVRTSLRDRLVAVAFGVLLFTAVRNVPVFAFAVAPIALAALPRGRAREDPQGPARALAWSTLGVAAFAAALLFVLPWQAAPARESTLPFGPARVLLDQARTPPRVFCEDFAWCSLFLAEAVPARFFMDGRCDPYPADVWREYRDVLDGNRRWAAILDRRRIDAVLVRRDGALDSLLAERSGIWRSIAADAHARLYVRPALIARSPAVPRGA
ncbi:MAG: hypothetical protein JWO85_3216 [Candidatus Eremiobacteraeota bacterium]|nr:hypothetical protein [Candidatus Eremiobacteraeota bacterium]